MYYMIRAIFPYIYIYVHICPFCLNSPWFHLLLGYSPENNDLFSGGQEKNFGHCCSAGLPIICNCQKNKKSKKHLPGMMQIFSSKQNYEHS